MKYIEPLPHFIDVQFQDLTAGVLEVSDFFLFHGGDLLLKSEHLEALSYDELPAGLSNQEFLYMGTLGTKPYCAASISKVPDEMQAVSLRNLLDTEQWLFQLAGRAWQLINWDTNHQYCGRCGVLTQRAEGELVRVCGRCDLSVYPRISPCVIMLVHRGDKILLAQRPGRQSSWYTVQAGFIEAGESAEQAVIREVREETGLSVDNLRYFGSQPWPFPGQLMLGYIAENREGELQPDPEELANADWFDCRDLPEYPGANTLSGKLIRHFVSERDAG